MRNDNRHKPTTPSPPTNQSPLHVFSISSSLSPKKYFTLVELMVSIGIILLVASISLVAISPFLEGRRLDSAVRVVKTAVYQARTYAANRRQKAKVHFHKDDGKIEVKDENGDPIEEPYWLPDGIEFESVPSPDPVFASTGSLENYSGDDPEIKVKDNSSDDTKTITIIHTSGVTRVE